MEKSERLDPKWRSKDWAQDAKDGKDKLSKRDFSDLQLELDDKLDTDCNIRNRGKWSFGGWSE